MLNKEPSNSMVSKRQNIKYISVSNVEVLLDQYFFGLWKTTDMKWQVVANEIIVSLELHVFHPKAGIWISRSGIGSCMIRQKSGADLTDIGSKIKNGLEMDAPHAKADAMKNAAKSLGKIFGRDLTRKDSEKGQYKPLIKNANLAKLAAKKQQENEGK